MSNSSHDPGGIPTEPRLVPFTRLSADHTFAYQCSFDHCSFGCIGGAACRGIKIPLMSPGLAPGMLMMPPTTYAQPQSVSSSSPSLPVPARNVPAAVVSTAVPPQPVPEINQLLQRSSESLDPTSPTTRQYLKGIIFSYIIIFYFMLDSEVTAFAEWQAVNSEQKQRARDGKRRSRVQSYKGIFSYLFCYFQIF